MSVDTGREGPGNQPIRWLVSRGALVFSAITLFFGSSPNLIIDADRTVTVPTDLFGPLELGQRELGITALGLSALGLLVYFLTKPRNC